MSQVLFDIQGKRRILATDEWLQVKGTQNVYAIGDCATIDQRKIMVYDTITAQLYFTTRSV